MGKLILILISAAAGFVAAVAATPEDAERRAFDRGCAAGAKALQSEAVQAGYASWEAGGAPQAEPTFRWATLQPRWRGGREWSEAQSRHQSQGDRAPGAFRPGDRPRKNFDREEPDVG